jgi:hypothetical protein
MDRIPHFRPQPTVDQIFRQPPSAAADLDDDLVFDRAAELENPLSVPLVAALRKIRELRDICELYREALKAAIETLYERNRELESTRRENARLRDELRRVRELDAA